MLYGKLRRYKCRLCGRVFKDYYLPEEKRVSEVC
jgi:transposase-like protein